MYENLITKDIFKNSAIQLKNHRGNISLHLSDGQILISRAKIKPSL